MVNGTHLWPVNGKNKWCPAQEATHKCFAVFDFDLLQDNAMN